MKKSIQSKILLLVMTIAVLMSTVTPVLAAQTAKSTPSSVEYNPYEAIVIGQPVQIMAKVTRDGVTAEEPIKYTSFPATEINKLFGSFTAKGYIDGWKEEIVQTIIVVPENLEYMMNFGGNSTENEYIAPGEGVLGLELDHSGNSGVHEPYFEAILRKFPELRNKTSAKQFGQNTEQYGNWGYVGTEFVGTAKITVKEKDLYEKILFPKRGTDDVEVKAEIPQGKYDIYIGTYSYWFSRPCTISVNNQVVAENYQLMPSRQVYKVTVEHTTNSPLSVMLEGEGLYDESMISFLCITKADESGYSELMAPQAPESIQLTDKEFLVSGLTPGAKLVVYDYNSNHLLYEQLVNEDTTELNVPLQDWQMTSSLSRIAVMQVNKEHVSPVTVLQRTDIESMNVSFLDEFTAYNVVCNVEGKASSKIVQLQVKRGDQVIIDKQANSESSDFAGSFEIEENGTYDVILYSGSGATSTQTITVSKIDKPLPTLALALNLKTAKLSSAGALVMELNAGTLAPIQKLTCRASDGTETELDASSTNVKFDKSGVYTVAYTNVLGKQAAAKVMVALQQQDIQTVKLSQSSSGRAVVIGIQSANGYNVKEITVYATTEDGTEKMIVNGANGDFSFNMYDKGTYFVQVLTADGSLEVFTLDVADFAPAKAETGMSAVELIGIAVMVLGAASLIAVAVLFVIQRKKKSV